MSKLGFGPIARHFFHDKLHVSYSIHILIANILARWMEDNVDRHANGVRDTQGKCVISVAPDPERQTVLRASNLLKRSMAVVVPDAPVRYDAPSGYRAAALLLNQSATCGVLWIETATGRTEIDMRFSPPARPFTAVVAPIPDDVGDGPFTLGVRSGDGAPIAGRRYWYVMPTKLEARAEVAEIALVSRDLVVGSNVANRSIIDVSIESEPWVLACIRDHAARFEALSLSSELNASIFPKPLFESAFSLVASSVGRPPEILQAFLAVSTGDLPRAVALLTALVDKAGSDAAWRQLLASIVDFQTAFR
jgi:hypothetical protein